MPGYLIRITSLALLEVVSATTGPVPAVVQIRAISTAVLVLPVPGGPIITSARRGEISKKNAAAAWSIHSPHPVTSLIVAARLARLVELAPSPGSVPSLTPSPSWIGWDHTEPGLWPRPEDRDVDLNAYSEPQWLDRVAVAVRDRLRALAGGPVIGHGDWWPGNLRWQGSELLAVYDWDSVICQPEPAIAGFAAVSFRGIGGPAPLASVDDSAGFLDAYQQNRGCRWTSQDYAAFWAAGLWQRAFDAKTLSLDGDPEQILTRHEARARLYRAGLNPDLVAEGREDERRCGP